mgnify:CR=1 FL=1
MTKQPKVRKPHPVLHGIGLVLSVILLAAVLISTYVLSTLATVIDSFFGAPSGHYSDAEIADTKVKAEALAADVEAEGRQHPGTGNYPYPSPVDIQPQITGITITQHQQIQWLDQQKR